jgi:hypothetical protein
MSRSRATAVTHDKPGQPMPGNSPAIPGRDEGGGPTRKRDQPGYAPDEPVPGSDPKAPGEGRPDEPQNLPTQKPGHGNG